MATPSARSPRRPTEFLGIIVSCVGALALLLGLIPDMIRGPLGLALLGFATLAVAGHLLVTARAGQPVMRGIVEAAVVAGAAFALVYGVIWYFTVYLASQPDFLRLTPPPSP